MSQDGVNVFNFSIMLFVYPVIHFFKIYLDVFGLLKILPDHAGIEPMTFGMLAPNLYQLSYADKAIVSVPRHIHQLIWCRN